MATTITVEDDTLKRFNALKANTGDDNVPELSANDFLKSLLDAWEENDEAIYGDQYADVNATELAREIETMIDTAAYNGGISEERAGEILGRIDDLEARLPRKIKEELR
jgi:hypothetical protein